MSEASRFPKLSQPHAVLGDPCVVELPCDLGDRCFNRQDAWGPGRLTGIALAAERAALRIPKQGWLSLPLTLCVTCAIELALRAWARDVDPWDDLSLFDHVAQHMVLQDYWCPEHNGHPVLGNTTVRYNPDGVEMATCSDGYRACRKGLKRSLFSLVLRCSRGFDSTYEGLRLSRQFNRRTSRPVFRQCIEGLKTVPQSELCHSRRARVRQYLPGLDTWMTGSGYRVRGNRYDGNHLVPLRCICCRIVTS
mgnify:CR=1 FL=1